MYLQSELNERWNNNAKYIRTNERRRRRRRVKMHKTIQTDMCNVFRLYTDYMVTTVSNVIRIFDILTNRKIDNKLHSAIYTSIYRYKVHIILFATQ